MRQGERIGAYQLEAELGEGGMKVVWRAIDVRDGRAVAVAVLHRFSPGMFRNEVMLARRVAHPHVARVLDGFVTDDGMGVVVSELCEGLDLARYRQGHEPSVGDALAIGYQLALGLGAIHAAHVLHRDVKPSNAILTRDGVKVIDFGISLPAADDKTGVGGDAPVAGTLPYMAPEVMEGDVDARSDAYSFGVSLYELITGELPLPRLSPHGLIQRLVERTPVPLDGLAHAGVDPRVRALVARLCEPEVARRPYLADVVEELGALVTALGGVVPEVVLPAGGTPVVSRDTVLDGVAAPVVADAPSYVPSPTYFPYPAPSRGLITVPTPHPGCVVVGWPHLPVVALVPDGRGTQVRAHDGDGVLRAYVEIADVLRGGLVADLDGDGVGELYAWSDARVWVIDAGLSVRFHVDTPRRPGASPWDDGAPAPLVLEARDAASGRALAVGNAALDPVTRVMHGLGGGWEGEGDALIDARGVTGFSAHGAARQRFRGDVGTAAAILTAPRQPGFVVAALERVFDGHPTVRLGLWGPGGRRVGGGDVGRYALETAPASMCEAAQSPATALFPPHVAPLALVGDGAPADDVIVVPFLVNAPWFGPLLIAFDGTGAERWRERLERAIPGDVAAPPMLVDLDGSGRPQVLWGTSDGIIHRRDARTGATGPAPAGPGVPIAALDLGGRGVLQLVAWTPSALHLIPCGPCLPGAIHWLPLRGDLWRSGTLGPTGLPVGPRA